MFKIEGDKIVNAALLDSMAMTQFHRTRSSITTFKILLIGKVKTIDLNRRQAIIHENYTYLAITLPHAVIFETTGASLISVMRLNSASHVCMQRLEKTYSHVSACQSCACHQPR